MSKHLYPAVFLEEDEGYSVTFPDFDGCFSEGDTLEDAYEMAFDALGLYLDDKTGKEFVYPKASNPKTIKLNDNEFVVMVELDMQKYFKKHSSKAVKKTLTIPEWLNDAATRENVNFSNVLQNALIKELNISNRP